MSFNCKQHFHFIKVTSIYLTMILFEEEFLNFLKTIVMHLIIQKYLENYWN